jgi:hypothetical protein
MECQEHRYLLTKENETWLDWKEINASPKPQDQAEIEKRLNTTEEASMRLRQHLDSCEACRNPLSGEMSA